MSNWLIKAIFIPNDVLRTAAGIEQIEVSITVHIYRAEIVTLLSFIKRMDFETTSAIVFVPANPFTSVTATSRVQIAIVVVVGNGQAVRLLDILVDFMNIPAWVFEPEYTCAMASEAIQSSFPSPFTSAGRMLVAAS